MSISALSGDIGNIAICMLCAITSIRGFHRSLAFVLPSTLRYMIDAIVYGGNSHFFTPNMQYDQVNPWYLLIVDFPATGNEHWVSMVDIQPIDEENDGLQQTTTSIRETNEFSMEKTGTGELSFQDVSLAFAMSHVLQGHFLGLGKTEREMRPSLIVVIAWSLTTNGH